MEKTDEVRRPMVQRVLLMVVGNTLLACGSAGFLFSYFGVDPFPCLATGLSALSTVPYAYMVFLIHVPALVLCLCTKKHRWRMGVGTVLNMSTAGFITQFVLDHGLKPHLTNPGMPLRLAIFAIGLCLVALGFALYMQSNMGMPPMDTVPILVASSGKIAFRWARVGLDLSMVVLGVLTGWLGRANIWQQIGVGTLIIALTLGPLTQWFVDVLFPQRRKPLAADPS